MDGGEIERTYSLGGKREWAPRISQTESCSEGDCQDLIIPLQADYAKTSWKSDFAYFIRNYHTNITTHLQWLRCHHSDGRCSIEFISFDSSANAMIISE